MTTRVITGVNRGIGAALLAGTFARKHTVIGTTREGRDGTVPPILDDLAHTAAQLPDLPPIDVLINTVGIIGPDMDQQTPLNMDWGGSVHTLTVITMAPLAVEQAVLPRLRDGAAPMLLAVSSQMELIGYHKPTQIACPASKSALNIVMQGLATTLEPYGISVIFVDPGWVSTDMGGMNADQDLREVAAGILGISAGLTLAATAKFFRFSIEKSEL